MSMGCRLYFCLAGVLTHFTCVKAVLGEPLLTNERVSVIYEVPSNCPSRTYFEGRVQSRVQRRWLATEGESARLLKVSAKYKEATWSASLDFSDVSGRVVTRTVKGATCEEAVAAIALVTALAIESQEVGSQERNGGVSSQSEGVIGQGASRSTENTSNVDFGTLGPVGSKESDDTNEGLRPLSFEVGLSYLRTQGVGPGYANGLDVFFGLSPNPSTSLVRFGFTWLDSGTDTTDLPRVKARAQAVAGRVQSCPFRLELFQRVSMPLCGSIEVGLLNVSGVGSAPELTKSRSDQVFWLVPSLSPRLRWDVGAFFVEVGPEFRVFLTQRQFSVRYGDNLGQAFETPLGHVGLVGIAGLHF
jgi:hypothetical protein